MNQTMNIEDTISLNNGIQLDGKNNKLNSNNKNTRIYLYIRHLPDNPQKSRGTPIMCKVCSDNECKDLLRKSKGDFNKYGDDIAKQCSKTIWRVGRVPFTNYALIRNKGNSLHRGEYSIDLYNKDDYRYILTYAATKEVQHECNAISNFTYKNIESICDCNSITFGWWAEYDELASEDDEYYIENNHVYRAITDDFGRVTEAELCHIRVNFDNVGCNGNKDNYTLEFYDFIGGEDDVLSEDRFFETFSQHCCFTPRARHLVRMGIERAINNCPLNSRKIRVDPVVVELDENDSMYYHNPINPLFTSKKKGV